MWFCFLRACICERTSTLDASRRMSGLSMRLLLALLSLLSRQQVGENFFNRKRLISSCSSSSLLLLLPPPPPAPDPLSPGPLSFGTSSTSSKLWLECLFEREQVVLEVPRAPAESPRDEHSSTTPCGDAVLQVIVCRQNRGSQPPPHRLGLPEPPSYRPEPAPSCQPEPQAQGPEFSLVGIAALEVSCLR